MSKLTNTVPSRESIRRGRKAVELEMQAAQTFSEDAALAAAMAGTEEARTALQAAQARVAGLRAELDGLTALAAAAGRHEAAQARSEHVASLKAQEAAALTAVDEVPPAFTAVQAAIRSLGEALRHFDARREYARQQVIACNVAGVDGLLLGAGALVREAVLAEGLGAAVDVRGALQRQPEYFPESMSRISDQSRWLVQTGVAAKIEAVEAAGRPHTTQAEAEEPYARARPAVHAVPGNPGAEYVV